MYRLGIDIGGTKINVGILDKENRLAAYTKLYVKNICSFTDAVKKTVQELCTSLKISCDEIQSCGIGVPGTVSEDGRKLLKAPNISILSENMVEELEEVLCMPVSMIQDSRAAAYGEYVCGEGQGAQIAVCVTLGTGIGTGIVMNGSIYSGALGSAGELGHLCVVENGRTCGCGKNGCLEKYCAGGGLDITAEELLGEGKTAADLFEAARLGELQAKDAISKAVDMLGGAMVAIVNLLSPDCLLFSGGLSEQEELYLKPVIKYIREHCYISGKTPKIKKAALGEFSPLIGAALFVKPNLKREPLLSASIMCADPLNLGDALKEIQDAGIQYIHCDIMDNHFVPNLMLPMELLNKLHEHTELPYDYHIMAEHPETIIEKLVVKKGDIVSVHYESTPHLQLLLQKIKEKGAKAAVAVNPSTPIEVLSETLCEIDMVLLMSVNPGFSGQKIVPSSFDKIRRLRKLLDEKGYQNVAIEVDGNCSFENVPNMYKAGAEIFVVGTSSVFSKDMSIREATQKLYSCLQ